MPSSYIKNIISDAAARQGLDQDYLDRIAKIESGYKPNARTGSYKGLFQLSDKEFQRYGGRNIYDPTDNAHTAAAMMADQREEFTKKYGRPPEPVEAYMIHQQGAGGLDAHLANPDRPAWENMYSTAEGQKKGVEWSKRAIWGNVPDDIKPQFGNVNNVTSDAFINQVWKPKVEGDTSRATGSPAGPPVQADEALEAQMAAQRPTGASAPAGSVPQGASASASPQARATFADLNLGLGQPAGKAPTSDFGWQLSATMPGQVPPTAAEAASQRPPPISLAQLQPIPMGQSLLARYRRT